MMGNGLRYTREIAKLKLELERKQADLVRIELYNRKASRQNSQNSEDVNRRRSEIEAQINKVKSEIETLNGGENSEE